MKSVRRLSRFRKDVERAARRGKNLAMLQFIIEDLAAGKALPVETRDHPLKGEYAGARECHIEPDWLLIYIRSATEITLVKTGSHADLFG